MNAYRTFLVPFDFSDHAEAALATAIELGRRLEADLHLVHVIQHPAYIYGYAAYGASPSRPAIDLVEIREGAIRSLREVAERIDSYPGRLDVHVFEGPGIADGLREAAEELDADLIVMGTHGRTGLAHVFLGSVAERTLRRAPCPVLTVQARETRAAA